MINANVPDEDFVDFLDDAFGLRIAETTPDISDEMKQKIKERFEAKKVRDFAKADQLRNEISEEGIVLLDGANGTIWQFAK